MNIRLQIAVVALAAAGAIAVPKPGSALPLAESPLFLTGDVPPMVMLNISKDHQLSYKAYTDYNDLTGDGVPETAYTHSFNYYGYFDTDKCYSYDTGANRYAPQSVTADKYCSGQWSGNFLNWATMTRMDIVRKILYGGMRSADTDSLTVLERAYLPADAHAFAKHYDGGDIAKLTPFTTTPTTPATGQFTTALAVSIGTGEKTFTDSTVSVELGDQVRVVDQEDSSSWMVGGVTSMSGSTFTIQVDAGGFNGSGDRQKWSATNLSSTGITLCNVTPGAGSEFDQYSQTNTQAPLIRVAKGNFALWGANEKRQCGWADVSGPQGLDSNLQSGFTGGFRSNGNRALLSGINASAENPLRAVHGLGTGSATAEYVARLEVCKSEALIGKETCKRYPSGNYKPSGLLQQYGDDGLIRFGLMTGSFSKNISGGVLRQLMSSFGDGVNVTTDGTFKMTGSDPAAGIVRTLNRIRIYGYDYASADSYGSSEGCTYQRTGIVTAGASGSDVNEGNCSSWGNPMSEIYLESLRYLAGGTSPAPTPAFLYGSDSKDSKLGLTVDSNWTAPLNENNYCTPLSVLNFNASVSSYDGDQLSSADSLNTPPNAAALTNAVGTAEGISGGSWFVGRSGWVTNELCSAKTVTNFGSILGLCPEAPSMEGSYLIAGLAHFARTNPIKPLPNGVSATSYPNAHTVETYGVALSSNVPRIEVNVNNKHVTILPAYRLDLASNGDGPFGGGTLVDFRIVEQTPTTGKFYVNWEDSEMGGDYDQDMWGVIQYQVSGDTIKVTTDAVSASTMNGQGFGYVISGTTQDGPHFHSGIYSFDYTDPVPVTVMDASGTTLNNDSTSYINTSGGCRDCTIDNPATSVTYSVTGNSAGNLKDPLWYAAKYGGFKDANGNNLPDRASEWDEDGDGNPDTFVFASDPVKLAKGLGKAFSQIAKRRTSATAVATNSSQLSADSKIFQARFDSSDWSGSLYATTLLPDGTAGSQIWAASEQLPAFGSRNIFTRTGTTGTRFLWANLDSGQQADLAMGPSKTADALGASRVDYISGDRSMERQQPGGVFRDRGQPLGDIVNSNPFFVQRQYLAYERLPGNEGTSYAAFSSGNKSRTPMVYVGGNDGMLHAFNASTGREVFAYVPQGVYSKLSALTDPNYSHQYYVDGSPNIGEAYFGSAWHTVLVSGLGAGGRSVFALDATSPTTFGGSNVLWELKDRDLCYSYSRPVIARLANGRWAAVFGNGYPRNGAADPAGNCTTAGAFLYVVDLEDGSLIRKIATSSTTFDGVANGLSSPTLVDANGDRITDLVYAGDLRGNMWKFDLSSANPSDWGNANREAGAGVPLYSAKGPTNNIAQPITSAPEVGRHPDGGVLVYFGTGQYVATGDPSNKDIQSFYAIWDKARPAVSNRVYGVRSSVLQGQSILSESSVGGRDVRTLTNNTVDWSSKLGWYIDLVRPPNNTVLGERIVNSPLLRFDRVIFNTLIPSTASCSFGGTSWLMETSATTGQRIEPAVFDLNGDGQFNSGDDSANTSVGGVRSRVGITQSPAMVSVPGANGTPAGREYKMIQSGSDTTGPQAGIESTTERGGGQSPRGSWRQIPAK